MSLDLDGFVRVSKECRAVEKRLTDLIGFNPTTCDHYGVIRLYNHRITSRTSDEEILAVRKRYLEWRERVRSFFTEIGYPIEEELFFKLFSADTMWGTLKFLDIPVDVDGDISVYREAIISSIEEIKKFIEREKQNNEE